MVKSLVFCFLFILISFESIKALVPEFKRNVKDNNEELSINPETRIKQAPNPEELGNNIQKRAIVKYKKGNTKDSNRNTITQEEKYASKSTYDVNSKANLAAFQQLLQDLRPRPITPNTKEHVHQFLKATGVNSSHIREALENLQEGIRMHPRPDDLDGFLTLGYYTLLNVFRTYGPDYATQRSFSRSFLDLMISLCSEKTHSWPIGLIINGVSSLFMEIIETRTNDKEKSALTSLHNFFLTVSKNGPPARNAGDEIFSNYLELLALFFKSTDAEHHLEFRNACADMLQQAQMKKETEKYKIIWEHLKEVVDTFDV